MAKKAGLIGIETVTHNLNRRLGVMTARGVNGMRRSIILIRGSMETTPPLVPIGKSRKNYVGGNLRASWFQEFISNAAKGQVGIVFGTQDGKVYMLGDNAKIKWFYSIQEKIDEIQKMFLDEETAKSIYTLPTLADINKDGKKEVVKIPKYKLITTHTMRRSFTTNQYLAGNPVVSIMAVTGHKTEKEFLKYIRITSAEHAKILQENYLNRYKIK